MNLKEAFRYQKFLDSMMYSAAGSIRQREHALTMKKLHRINEVNPDVPDKSEEILPDHPFFQNDDVIRFMVWLSEEKQKLSVAIGRAKADAGFDIDAAIRAMLNFTGSTRVENGKGFKFNNDGDQTAYYYDVEVTTTEAFDRDAAKEVARRMIQDADRVSAGIDSALINLQVGYEPVFDVNESFEDVMTGFLSLS